MPTIVRSGIYVIAATILKLGMFHNLHGGTIIIACDGESTFHWGFKP